MSTRSTGRLIASAPSTTTPATRTVTLWSWSLPPAKEISSVPVVVTTPALPSKISHMMIRRRTGMADHGLGLAGGEADAEERRARLEACRLARHPRHGQRDGPHPGDEQGDEQDDEDADRSHRPRGYPEVR